MRRRSHEGCHGATGGRRVGPLRGGARAGRAHRFDPGRGGGGRGSAGPTSRSRRAPTAGRLPGGSGSSSGTSRWVGCSTRAAAGCRRATSSSGSSGVPTRCRAATAPSVSGTCAATGSTPSGASRSSTGSCPSDGGSSPATSPSSIRRSASSGVLLEPTTVVAKAWELVGAMRARAFWEPRAVLVTGAGPIGMLAALHRRAARPRGPRARPGRPRAPSRSSSRDLGATYHAGTVADIGFEPDVVIECTGVGPVIVDSIRQVGAGGVVCLTGVGSGGPAERAGVGRPRHERWSCGTTSIVGSVNANRRHFYRGRPGARRRRPGLARTADLPPGAARRHRRGARHVARTTSRSSWTSEARGERCGAEPRRGRRARLVRAEPAR